MTDDDATRRVRAALVDTTLPNAVRVGDYLYGGRNNFEADRKVARALVAAAPSTALIPQAGRAFHQRAVRYLVAEAGVTQFLHIGTGLSPVGNTHDVAQSMDPTCRIVYADSDPVVLAHARALMTSTPEGAIGYLDTGVGDPGALASGASATLDFTRPVAFLLLATLSFVLDAGAASAIVRKLLNPAPAGSHVVIYHQASDLDPATALVARRWNRVSSRPVTHRSRQEVADLVAGLDVVPPGVVPVCEWRPVPDDPRFGDVVPVYGVVARKP